MKTHRLQMQARKISEIHALCVEVSAASDMRIIGYITRYFAILAASYVELSLQEMIRRYAEARSSKHIANVIAANFERQNSIDCNKIKNILNQFDKSLYEEFELICPENSRNAINSLKNLRDTLAHGNDNGTSYIKVKEYYDLVLDLPDHIDGVLSKL